jgi:hypothetical protein
MCHDDAESDGEQSAQTRHNDVHVNPFANSEAPPK